MKSFEEFKQEELNEAGLADWESFAERMKVALRKSDQLLLDVANMPNPPADAHPKMKQELQKAKKSISELNTSLAKIFAGAFDKVG